VGSARGAEIADQIERANLELIQVVRGCSEEQWRTLCNDEGDNRTVAVIAHHVAHGHQQNQDWLDTALGGGEVKITLAEQDVLNAQQSPGRRRSGSSRGTAPASPPGSRR